ncbi:Sodium - Bile acid symporter [Streptomyces lividans 1326]|uniref:Sodium-Bile acid symporter n=1 Tax=Streptomyces lividans 1326 TaxID=1200984 RepID=A0A7U9DWQ7_STRLI|nr:Sodium - Bile acid symporter [Streptomyces lividans 1326]
MKRLRWPRWMPIDPYILLLLGTVGLAALLPARGTGADVGLRRLHRRDRVPLLPVRRPALYP